MKRAIVIVIDGLGIGALPDALTYGDSLDCNTLLNVARSIGGLELPNLQKMGLGNILPIEGIAANGSSTASYGRMMEVSKGKDSTTGHWELAGLVLDEPFPVYPNGFPDDLMAEFVSQAGCGGYLGNSSASGTDVIDSYCDEHARTGRPIVYTSADSVLQIASDIAVVPVETLYFWCLAARKLLTGKHNVSRVVARPYRQTDQGPERLSASRRDFAIPPWKPTILNRIVDRGGRVIGIGKIADLFANSGITHSVRTHSNEEGISATIAALKHELHIEGIAMRDHVVSNACCELIFTNLVDTDTKYGHRRDPVGYARSLVEFDRHLPLLLECIGPDDLLVMTSDHGCDPTAQGTDHTREYVPLLVYNSSISPRNLGTRESFAYVSEIITAWLGIDNVCVPTAIATS